MNLFKKINYLSLLYFLLYAFIFLLFLRQGFSYLDPDLGWHLSLGKEIWETGKVPQINHQNFTLAGQSYVDHEWLSNLLLYLGYEKFGYLFINIIFALIPSLIFFFLNRLAQKEYRGGKLNLIILAAIEILAVLAIAPHCGVRIQELSVLGTLLLFLILYNYEKGPNYKKLLWLIPLFYLWANLHGGFLAGFIILALFSASKLIEFLLRREKSHFFELRPWDLKQLGQFVLFSFLAFSSTFLTPYFFKLYEFIFSTYSNTFYFNHISEWLPQWNWPYVYPQIIYLSLVFIMLGLGLYQAHHQKTKIKFWSFVLILAFAILAMKSRRHAPLLVVLSLPYLINFFRENLSWERKKIVSNFERPLWFIRAYIIFVCFMAVLNQAVGIKIFTDPFKKFCEKEYQPGLKTFLYPCAATEFLKNNEGYRDLKMLNAFGWGGYLIYAWPEKQLFIDGRLPQANYNNHSLLEEYYEFDQKEKTEAKLKEHGIEMVLLESREKRINLNWLEKNFLLIKEDDLKSKDKNLKNYLVANWTLVYQDQIASVYVAPQ